MTFDHIPRLHSRSGELLHLFQLSTASLEFPLTSNEQLVSLIDP
jgi:hypothetical protein